MLGDSDETDDLADLSELTTDSPCGCGHCSPAYPPTEELPRESLDLSEDGGAWDAPIFPRWGYRLMLIAFASIAVGVALLLFGRTG